MSKVPRIPQERLLPCDYKLVYIATATVALCSLSIPGFYYPNPLNEAILYAIPRPLVPLLLALPFFLYFALAVHRHVRWNDQLIQSQKEAETRTYGRVLFLAQMRPNAEGGTEWKVGNVNKFDWTGCRIMIEARSPHETMTESHLLGTVKASQQISIQSKLAPQEHRQWRIMVLTNQGRLIDFPDSWVDAEIPVSETEELVEV